MVLPRPRAPDLPLLSDRSFASSCHCKSQLDDIGFLVELHNMTLIECHQIDRRIASDNLELYKMG